ncbi:hypothetical protein, partial [Azospirillum sp. A39]
LAEVLGALAAHGPVAVSDDDLIDEGDDPAAIETLCGTDADAETATPASIRSALRSPLAVSRDRPPQALELDADGQRLRGARASGSWRFG